MPIQRYRTKEKRLVVGVMSGTSLDGVDVAFVELSGTGSQLQYTLRGFHCIPYTSEMKALLLAASSGDMNIRDAFELDADLGSVYASAIIEAAEVSKISATAIDAIGLHGQTVYHAPLRQPNGLTVQLGTGAIVAQRCGALVVDDFRSADVAAGGQGAPLVPYCDLVMLRHPNRNRVALNIGGIANITWLPKGATAEKLIAFDTGPGNMMIDAAMRELRGEEYDKGGAFGAQGKVETEWLEELMEDEYVAQPPPKSCGREQYGEGVGGGLAHIGLGRGLSEADTIATLTALTARSIAHGITRHAARDVQVDEVIVSGGGVQNETLMQMLREELPMSRIVSSDVYGIPADAKEAICFAILANEALCGTAANVPSVTGAHARVICGAIRLPGPQGARKQTAANMPEEY